MFERDVRPILKLHCFHCHGESGEKEGGLDLRLRRLIVEGGDSGTAFFLAQPEDSLLLERIRSGEMSSGEGKALSAADISIISRWIATGARTARPEPETIDESSPFTKEELEYWIFQPVIRPPVPAVQNLARKSHGA